MFAHKEVYGAGASSYKPNAAESDALTQFNYFTDSKNRTNAGTMYWLRSMSKDDTAYWLCGYQANAAGKDKATETRYYAPTRFFGAI